MIVDQRYVDYINSLEKELPPYLEELEQYALQTEVPIIRKEMQSFLKTLLKMNKPKQILEVGITDEGIYAGGWADHNDREI